MQISLKQIQAVFSDLISEKVSREFVSDWARRLREADDHCALTYDPIDSEKIIWGAILFLEGVDLKNSPDEYLHTITDFKNELDRLLQ